MVETGCIEMAKVAEQNIPSGLRELWEKVFPPTLEALTGYNYTIANYSYCGLLASRQSPANNNKQGFEYPKISQEQAEVRCRLTKASRWANEQVESGGTEYPETGPRDKSWWYDNIPIGHCYWNDYCIEETYQHLDYHRVPPWAMEPIIWISAQLNHRIERWNGRTMTYLDCSEGGVGPGEAFGNVTRACCDETRVFVPDYTNDRIHILNKDTLEYIKFYTETEGAEHQFNNIQQVAVDDENLFIQEYTSDVIYVVNKETFALVHTINLAIGGDEFPPSSAGITLDYNYVSVADYDNSKIKIYNRKSFGFVKWVSELDEDEKGITSAEAIVSDGQNIYALDPGHSSNLTLNIASGEMISENRFANAIEGSIGISGDLVFTMGLISGALWKTVRPNMVELDSFFDPGTNPGQQMLNMGVCGPQAFVWDAC